LFLADKQQRQGESVDDADSYFGLFKKCSRFDTVYS